MAGLSFVNGNLVIAKEVLLLLERENKTRKRKTYEREEDEETGGRLSGRGREVQQFVGGRESKRKRNHEEDWTSSERSEG